MDIAEGPPGDYTNVEDASTLPDIYGDISQEVINICPPATATPTPTNRRADGDEHPYTDEDVHGNADEDGYAYQHGDADQYQHADADQHQHADADQHQHARADGTAS